MKNLYTYLFTAVLSTSLLTSCGSSQEKIKGDKDVISVSEDLPYGINTIEVSNDIEVRIVKAKSDDYILTTDRNLVSVVDFDVRDSILRIKTNMNVTSKREMGVYIKLIDPRHIIIHDDAEVRTPGHIESPAFSVTADKDSKFDLNITAARAKVNMRDNSTGELSLKGDKIALNMSGRTDLKGDFSFKESMFTMKDRAEFTPKGKSELFTLITEAKADFKGRKFEVQEADATLSSSSNATVDVAKALSIFAKDDSKIEIYGNPEVNVKALNDKAEIIKK